MIKERGILGVSVTAGQFPSVVPRDRDGKIDGALF